ncbi:hypothetical protein [Flavimarina sp. Hel_I_48]|uniref:hypothetical protein n=1 Tax=Flavimarina sp. Hel_I_48 TaxID=1392488 RepID=UPI0004DF4393|nr:hypothetical protein [Flavimarina sp. Hel_I_48]
MEYEKDYIQREIQRLSLVLQTLIEKITGASSKIPQDNFNEIDTILNINFDFSIEELINATPRDLNEKLKEIHPAHLEKLIDLLYILINKSEFTTIHSANLHKLISIDLILIKILDDRSKDFSIARMQHKLELEKHLKTP